MNTYTIESKSGKEYFVEGNLKSGDVVQVNSNEHYYVSKSDSGELKFILMSPLELMNLGKVKSPSIVTARKKD